MDGRRFIRDARNLGLLIGGAGLAALAPRYLGWSDAMHTSIVYLAGAASAWFIIK